MPKKSPSPQSPRSRFPALFWLAVIFEFFERGSYYGVMSVLSVYLTEHLHFAKTDVGLIKGTIQPLLYFLPIVSGALADRFGYRRTLLVAFSLLGGGYLLTAQATSYAAVFLSLVVMGIGAGTFKPIISGTIARCTDASNATLGFGIFYWTINLGAFLVPLFLVPFLKNNIGWEWVLVAAAIGTGAMVLPTLFLFREPPRPPADEEQQRRSLLETVANAFEILYSPAVLLYHAMGRSTAGRGLGVVLLGGLLGGGIWQYAAPGTARRTVSARRLVTPRAELVVRVHRNLSKPRSFALADSWGWSDACRRDGSRCSDAERAAAARPGNRPRVTLTVYNPDAFAREASAAARLLARYPGLAGTPATTLTTLARQAAQGTTLTVRVDRGASRPVSLKATDPRHATLTLSSGADLTKHRDEIRAALDRHPTLAALPPAQLAELVDKAQYRSIFLLYVGLVLLTALMVLWIAPRLRGRPRRQRLGVQIAVVLGFAAVLWLLPDVSRFAAILCSVIGLTLLSLFVIDAQERARFVDHGRFLLMIFLYAGFWVLYFQMFDSVLWYVQAYVDASSLNRAVNGAAAALGLNLGWRFDIEHVTVINAGTIILLQLLISSLVKHTRAMPTMIAGITLGTVGMLILALSPSIWTFMAGIVIFSIGEMTAHPKFIAYVGQTAPKSRVAMYMGYLFLYGVIGSSIGGVLGANLYVEYVDRRNDPQTLWFIFTGIGAATIVGLLLYNRFVAPRGADPSEGTDAAQGTEPEGDSEAANAASQPDPPRATDATGSGDAARADPPSPRPDGGS